MHLCTGVCWENMKMRKMVGKPRRISVNDINGDLKGNGWEYTDWI